MRALELTRVGGRALPGRSVGRGSCFVLGQGVGVLGLGAVRQADLALFGSTWGEALECFARLPIMGCEPARSVKGRGRILQLPFKLFVAKVSIQPLFVEMMENGPRSFQAESV